MLNKFKNLSLDRKLIFLFTLICASLPFAMARSPAEIVSDSLPLWANFYVEVGFWFADGKPFWQGFLACYGIATVEMFSLYFGTFGFRVLVGKIFSWIKKQLKKGVRIPFSENQLLFIRKRSGYDNLNHFTDGRKQKFVAWLSKQSTWILLLVIFLPIMGSDLSATAILGTRKIKYGHWYIAAVNIPHVFLIVLSVYFGIDFFFH